MRHGAGSAMQSQLGADNARIQRAAMQCLCNLVTSPVALAVLQCTALPLLVVITQIGLDTGEMRPGNAAALVGAGMLSVLVLPLTGFALLGGADLGADAEPDDVDVAGIEPPDVATP